MNKKRPVLVDLDEVLYPFVHTWDQWLKETKKASVDWEALAWHYDLDLYLAKHVDLQPDFVEAHKILLLDPKPIPGSIEALSLIAQKHPVIACTARNAEDWRGETETWLSKHAPYISDVIHIREGRGDKPIPKSDIAKKLNAYAHIDDTKHWIDTMPKSVKGYVVKRPSPLASDEGAITWDAILLDIFKR
jgi:hypothetical protein